MSYGDPIVFLDDSMSPWLCLLIDNKWWLCYWCNDNWVLSRTASNIEVERWRARQLPPDQAVLYEDITETTQQKLWKE